MATLIAAYRMDGTCIGRCDARCYNAQGDQCDCICGGKNHGVGLSVALKNTEEMVEEWMERYKQDHSDVEEFKVLPLPAQMDMFELLEAR